MRWFRHRPDTIGPDPIDAVLGAEHTDGDVADVAAIAHELRAAYLPAEAPARSAALAALSSVEEHERLPLAAGNQTTRPETPDTARPLPATAAAGPERRPPVIKTIAAFGATITGKVVLGTAVAAAAVGGAHAADVADLPGLPDQAGGQAQVEAGSQADDTADDRDDEGEGTASEAQDNGSVDGEGDGPADGAFGNSAEGDVPDDVQSYLDELETWVRCVQGNAAAQGDEDERTEGEFDPREDCDDRPDPRDHGLTDDEARAAEDARDDANGNADEGPDNAEDREGNAEQGKSNAEQGRSNGEDGRTNAEQGRADADNGEHGASTAEDGSSNADEGTSTAGAHDDRGHDASAESSEGLETADENDDAGEDDAEAAGTHQP